MFRKIIVCTFFLLIGGSLLAQEKAGKSGGGSSSSKGGSRRRAIIQRNHFDRPALVNTSGNGTSTKRGRYVRLSKGENHGFGIVGSLFRPKKENQGFASSTYRTKRNKKKGIY